MSAALRLLDAVEDLLKGTAALEGFAGRMDAVLTPMTSGAGLLEGRISSAGSELKRLTDSLGRMDKRLERKEEFYRRQFTSLETAMQRANAAQQEMAGQLAGLSGLNSRNK